MTRLRDRLRGEQPVEGALVEGGVVAALVARSERRELLVVERREHRGWEHLTRSTTASVAARSTVPVVCVPAGWRPEPPVRPVVVAVEDASRAPAEVWTAAALARVTRRPLRLLRVDPLAPAYRDVLRREGREEEHLRRVREELARDVDLPPSVREELACTFVVRWGRPAEVIVDETAGASLLVMARRDPLLPVGTHLGPRVRHVLRAATCPVLVVDPSRAALAAPGAA